MVLWGATDLKRALAFCPSKNRPGGRGCEGASAAFRPSVHRDEYESPLLDPNDFVAGRGQRDE